MSGPGWVTFVYALIGGMFLSSVRHHALPPKAHAARTEGGLVGDIPIVKAVSGIVGGIALFACVISGIRLVERGSDAAKIGQASREPESFKLEKLIARGLDGNVNVRVSDFTLDRQELAQTWKTNTGVKGIDHIWVVARVPGEANDSPVRVLVRARGSDGVNDLRRAREFQGLLINKIDRPSEEEFRRASS
jgi:hypothetical protein